MSEPSKDFTNGERVFSQMDAEKKNFHQNVDYALHHDTFQNPKEFLERVREDFSKIDIHNTGYLTLGNLEHAERGTDKQLAQEALLMEKNLPALNAIAPPSYLDEAISRQGLNLAISLESGSGFNTQAQLELQQQMANPHSLKVEAKDFGKIGW